MTVEVSEPAVDWRGTEIVVGQTVIYGAPVGRSIAMVEATVDGFTDSGRVWLKVKHRAYGGWGSDPKQRVHVGPDRLTVVLDLPPTELVDESAKAIKQVSDGLDRLRANLTALDEGGHAEEYWRNPDSHWVSGGRAYYNHRLTVEEGDAAYRKYLLREIKKLERKLERA